MELLEILGPILFLLLFGASRLFQKLKENPPDTPPPVHPATEDGKTKPSGDIFAEIRRRIQERVVIASEKPLPPEWIEDPSESLEEAEQPIAPPLVRTNPPNPPSATTEPLPKAPQLRRRINIELRGSKNLRRALLHREILGPPVALREETQ
ncbi:MAG: hypothetical protein HN996_13105 [Opitutae bacterium]|nr:hypothetical protein [Opitutae bacterium]